MNLKKYGFAILLGALVLSFAGCGGDGDTQKFKGFSDMVQEKREFNEKVSKMRGQKRQTPGPELRKRKKNRVDLEEDVVIKGRSSGKIIAYGRAFFDAEGNLINISIQEQN